jgi:phenylacetate-CoA ligase
MNERFPTRAEIEERQLTALRALIGMLLPCNRFYARKWEGTGLSEGLASLAEFYERTPFTRKAEIAEDQRQHPPYGSNLTYPVEEYTRFSQTSGTTGSPIRWLDTPQSWCWMVDRWVEVLRVSGVTPDSRIFFAFSFGPFLGFWTAFEAGLRVGSLCLPGGGMSSGGRLREILDNRVTVLCCTPTYALRLGEVAAEEGIDLGAGALRTIIAAGEPGASIPATRARLERMWPGARLWDHHGMTETGPVTYECPLRAGVLHVMESGFIPEVIDPATDAPTLPGETGELILTNLGRTGSPLVRYRTGDLVRRAAEERCVCGRYELALEGGILGRVDDMVVVRGVNLYPGAFEAVLRGFDRVAEYQVECATDRPLPEVTVWIEPVPGCSDAAELGRTVEATLRAAFHLRVPVAVVAPGALPRYELKSRRWVRLSERGGNV